jgi:hypothetical protein
MQAQTQSQPGTASPEERLERYLRERAADGEFYFKSKFVADEVGLTASQIGTLMTQLRDSTPGLEIEPWSYTNATTWRVAPDGE